LLAAVQQQSDIKAIFDMIPKESIDKLAEQWADKSLNGYLMKSKVE
jgi:hypothetical protein